MEAETTQSQAAQSQSFDVYKILAWLHANRKQVVIGLAALLVVGAGTGIYVWKKGQREADATEQMFALPSVFGANEKAARPTAEGFLNVAQEFQGTSAGEQSQLLAASVFFTEGKYPEAYNEFTKFLTEHAQSALAPQANVGIAASLEAQGKTAEAIQKYQDIISRYPGENVVGSSKLTLASLYEAQNKPGQALEIYDQLIKGATANQYDPWASEAKGRKDILLEKHPELNKPVASAPATPASINVQPNWVKVPDAPKAKK